MPGWNGAALGGSVGGRLLGDDHADRRAAVNEARMRQRMKLDRVLRRRWLSVPLVLALLVPASARAVTVNPTTVFVDSRTRTATLTLSNTGLRPEEIEIYFSFGIPVADELGSVRVIFLDSAGLEQRSIIDYVRAFPRRMRLEPGQTQVIRLLVQPPEGLPAGE